MNMYTNNKQYNCNNPHNMEDIKLGSAIPIEKLPEASNIHSSFEVLGLSLNFLRSTLDTLEDRLQPVLTPSWPEAATNESEVMGNVSAVQHNLNKIAESVRHMSSRMLDITERLDV